VEILLVRLGAGRESAANNCALSLGYGIAERVKNSDYYISSKFAELAAVEGAVLVPDGATGCGSFK
jgi:hypothetical protein